MLKQSTKTIAKTFENNFFIFTYSLPFLYYYNAPWISTLILYPFLNIFKQFLSILKLLKHKNRTAISDSSILIDCSVFRVYFRNDFV
jgi:hypothetical protein